MKAIINLLIILTLLGCSESYPNPSIVIKLDQPFVLRNTDKLLTPKGNIDIAVFPNEIDPEYKIMLKDIVDIRCKSCVEPKNSFYVEIDVNGKSIYLGRIENSELMSPTGTTPIKLSTPLENKKLTLLSIEKVDGNELINQTAKYKEVTLALTNL